MTHIIEVHQKQDKCIDQLVELLIEEGVLYQEFRGEDNLRMDVDKHVRDIAYEVDQKLRRAITAQLNSNA